MLSVCCTANECYLFFLLFARQALPLYGQILLHQVLSQGPQGGEKSGYSSTSYPQLGFYAHACKKIKALIGFPRGVGLAGVSCAVPPFFLFVSKPTLAGVYSCCGISCQGDVGALCVTLVACAVADQCVSANCRSPVCCSRACHKPGVFRDIVMVAKTSHCGLAYL